MRAALLTPLVTAFLLALPVSARPEQASTTNVLIFDRSVRRPPTADVLPEIHIPDQQTVIGNCTDLIRYLASGRELGEAAELPSFKPYKVCLEREVISRSRHFSTNPFNPRSIGQQLFQHLDLSSIASALAQRKPAEHYRFVDLNFLAHKAEAQTLTLKEKGFTYRMEAIALGDFLRNGRAQLLVRFSEKATQGSYDQTALYVLDWPDPQGLIEATSVLDLLRPGSR